MAEIECRNGGAAVGAAAPLVAIAFHLFKKLPILQFATLKTSDVTIFVTISTICGGLTAGIGMW